MSRAQRKLCPLIIWDSLSVGTFFAKGNIILNMTDLHEMAFYNYISLDVHKFCFLPNSQVSYVLRYLFLSKRKEKFKNNNKALIWKTELLETQMVCDKYKHTHTHTPLIAKNASNFHKALVWTWSRFHFCLAHIITIFFLLELQYLLGSFDNKDHASVIRREKTKLRNVIL